MGGFVFNIYNARKSIYICIATGFVYCLLFIGIMSLFAEWICYACIFITELGLIALPVLFSFKYIEENKAAADINFSVDEKAVRSAAAKGYLAGAICTSFLFVAFSLCLCCGWNSIKLAVNVVDAAADFIMSTKRILIIPFIYFLIQIVVMITWFFGFMCVMSMCDMHASSIIP